MLSWEEDWLLRQGRLDFSVSIGSCGTEELVELLEIIRGARLAHAIRPSGTFVEPKNRMHPGFELLRSRFELPSHCSRDITDLFVFQLEPGAGRGPTS